MLPTLEGKNIRMKNYFLCIAAMLEDLCIQGCASMFARCVVILGKNGHKVARLVFLPPLRPLPSLSLLNPWYTNKVY